MVEKLCGNGGRGDDASMEAAVALVEDDGFLAAAAAAMGNRRLFLLRLEVVVDRVAPSFSSFLSRSIMVVAVHSSKYLQGKNVEA
jgi:hypothetical protein